MTEESKKRGWLRFSIRGMLVMTAAFAVWFWWLFPPVGYHESLEGWTSDDSSRIDIPAIEDFHVLNVVDKFKGASYLDSNHDGAIDFRYEFRELLDIQIVSIDDDLDGFFDTEIWDSRSSLFNSRKKIHVPVPKLPSTSNSISP